MPGLDSFSAALQIRQLHTNVKIAFLTTHALPDQLVRARRLRLNGFILKKDDSEELFYALRTILGGGFYAPPSMSTFLRDQNGDQDPMSGLTQREKSVLTLYAQGKSIKEIAVELDVSVKTAETHRNNLGRKLGHPNRSQITAFALKHNLGSFG
jgi:two-component system nitrate/nitrite response regulator NarL